MCAGPMQIDRFGGVKFVQQLSCSSSSVMAEVEGHTKYPHESAVVLLPKYVCVFCVCVCVDVTQRI